MWDIRSITRPQSALGSGIYALLSLTFGYMGTENVANEIFDFELSQKPQRGIYRRVLVNYIA